mmetsp:Transcript_16109/g.21595  ORF Transcript_16109/g.21595 Transcript_16109/m.21595 type:complete len:122 (+) Transcript_16109:541-906(+)
MRYNEVLLISLFYHTRREVDKRKENIAFQFESSSFPSQNTYQLYFIVPLKNMTYKNTTLYFFLSLSPHHILHPLQPNLHSLIITSRNKCITSGTTVQITNLSSMSTTTTVTSFIIQTFDNR